MAVSTHAERLRRAIDRTDQEMVKPRIRDIKVGFVFQNGYNLALLVLGVVANLAPSMATVIGTFGLGTLGVGANFERLQNSVNEFLKDRRKLRDGIAVLRIRLDRCLETDEACLSKVDDLLDSIVTVSKQ